MSANGNSFLGRGWSFPPEFHKGGERIVTTQVEDEEDIRESLRILLQTRPGERVMHPAYGCGIHAMLFEQINESTTTEIRDLIERAVLFYEPRITLESIDIETTEAVRGKLLIQLNYTIRRTNTRSNIVFPFYYLEGSLVSE